MSEDNSPVEQQIDICAECIKDNDFSKKEVFSCELCGRWFCKKHLSPAFVHIPDFRIVQDRKFQAISEVARKRVGGHPCSVYTLNWFGKHQESEIEKETSPAEKEADRQRRIEALEKQGLYLRSAISLNSECDVDSKPQTAKEDRLSTIKTEEISLRQNHQSQGYPEADERKNGQDKYSEPKRKRKSLPTKKIISILLIAMIMGLLIWFSPNMISTFQNFLSKPSSSSQTNSTQPYTRITVPEQVTTVRIGNGEYSFMYIGLSAKFFVSISTYTLRTFSSIEGKVYQAFGIEIVVSEVHTDYVVLSVRAIPPHYYNLGEEILGYPCDQLAVTITYWKTTPQFHEVGQWDDAAANNTLVIFNYTLRNIADSRIDFYANDGISFSGLPLLKYDNYYATSTGSWLGYNLLFNEPLESLMPNQTTRGVLTYEILQGCRPVELVYPNKNTPEIIIEINSS